MDSGILRYRLFRRPSDVRQGWTQAGQLAVRIERGGADTVVAEGLVGTFRSPDGEEWEIRGEPMSAEPAVDGNGTARVQDRDPRVWERLGL